MPPVHHAKAERGKFCEPIFPEPRTRLWNGGRVHLQHRLICCDCGLAHDFEFVIVETRTRNGRSKMVRVAPLKFAIQFRARRNERSTAQIRRHKPKRKR